MNKSVVKEALDCLWKARQNNNLVIFVGSGVSKFYAKTLNKKFPDWKDLITNLSQSLGVLGNELDYLQIAQMYEDYYGRKELIQKVIDLFPKSYEPGELHELIFEVEPAHIITTNYDDLLERALKKSIKAPLYSVIIQDKNLPYSYDKSRFLVKIHGDLKLKNIVLTEKDYANYEKNFPLILSFLKYIFAKYRVVFIGFSLTDPNFKKILYWIDSILSEHKPLHVAVFYDDVEEITRTYFKSRGILVVSKKELEEFDEKLKNKENENKFLIPLFKFLKTGILTRDETPWGFLEKLAECAEKFEIFDYLLPSMIRNFIKEKINGKLLLYDSIADIVVEKKFSFCKFLLEYISKNKQEIKNSSLTPGIIDKINKILKMLLKVNVTALEEDNRRYIDIKDKFPAIYEKNKFYPTLNVSQNIILAHDYAFCRNSLYYDFLTLKNRNDFFVCYLLGLVPICYNILEKTIEEIKDTTDFQILYLNFYRIHHLGKFCFWLYLYSDEIQEPKVEKFKDDYEDKYRELFENLPKESRLIFEKIHNFSFAYEFKNKIDKIYEELEKNRKILETGGAVLNDFPLQFYSTYSRFLKFLFFNKLPIVHYTEIRTIIEKANKSFFEICILAFKYNKVELPFSLDNSFFIPEWMWISFLLEHKYENLKEKVFELIKDIPLENIKASFNRNYINDLMKEIINGLKIQKSLTQTKEVNDFAQKIVKLKNLILMLGIFSTEKEDFLCLQRCFLILMDNHLYDSLYESIEGFEIGYIKASKIGLIEDKDFKENTTKIINKIAFSVLNFELPSIYYLQPYKFGKFLKTLVDINIKVEINKSIFEKILQNLQKFEFRELNEYVLNLINLSKKKDSNVSKIVQKMTEKAVKYISNIPEKHIKQNQKKQNQESLKKQKILEVGSCDIRDAIILLINLIKKFSVNVDVISLFKISYNQLIEELKKKGFSSLMLDYLNIINYLIYRDYNKVCDLLPEQKINELTNMLFEKIKEMQLHPLKFFYEDFIAEVIKLLIYLKKQNFVESLEQLKEIIEESYKERILNILIERLYYKKEHKKNLKLLFKEFKDVIEDSKLKIMINICE